MKMKYVNQKGFTLVEILITMVVFAIGMLAVLTLQTTSIGGNSTGYAITGATSIAAEQLGHLVGMPYDHPFLVDPPAAGINYAGFDGLRSPLPRTSIVPVNSMLHTVPDIANYTSDYTATSADDLFTIYWNIAENYPINNTKTIQVIVIKYRSRPSEAGDLKDR